MITRENDVAMNMGRGAYGKFAPRLPTKSRRQRKLTRTCRHNRHSKAEASATEKAIAKFTALLSSVAYLAAENRKYQNERRRLRSLVCRLTRNTTTSRQRTSQFHQHSLTPSIQSSIMSSSATLALPFGIDLFIATPGVVSRILHYSVHLC